MPGAKLGRQMNITESTEEHAMNDKTTRGVKAASLLSAAALVLLLCILVPLTLCSMTVFAQLGLDGPF